MEQKPVRALFAWTERGHAAAVRIAGLYREAGMEIFLYGFSDGSGLAELGEERGMSHVLYFLDEERLVLSSLADEMGGFTAEFLVSELLLPGK